MGCSIKLVRRDDFISDIDVVDLSADGYALADNGYTQTVAPIGAKSVHEVITLKLQGTSKDDLAAMTQEIDEKIKQVQWWMDDPGVEKYQVWLRVQLDNETYSRQAQILNIQPPDKVKIFTPMEAHNNYIGEYSIGIERTPFWEGDMAQEVTKASLNVIGGAAFLSAAVAGDVPARLLRFRIGPHSGSNNISMIWAGFKTSRFGAAVNFEPVWKLNAGSYSADTTAVSDSSAYTGYRVVTTFFFTTMEFRTRVTASNVSTLHPEDQRGTYLVLMRAKMSDTSVARARIAYSFTGGFPVYRSRQVISGTAWNLYEMGVVKNPPVRIYNYHNFSSFTVEVQAELLSGTGDLHMDCLIMIPIDDGAIKATAFTSLSGAADQRIAIFQAADDKIWGLFENSGIGVYYPTQVSPQNGWALPNDTAAPLVVCAASDANNGCVKGGTLDFAYTYITRWRTLRGNTG